MWVSTYSKSVIKTLVEHLQKQPPEAFCDKGVLKNFAKFKGKHLFWSFFFNNFFKEETPTRVFQ